MISNEWHESQAPERRPYRQPQAWAPRVPHQSGPETILKQLFIQVEEKIFEISLKENLRGRYLRIKEDSNGKFNTIIVSEAGLEDLQTVINEMVKLSQATPPANLTSAAAPE